MAWDTRETARETSTEMGGGKLVQSRRTFGTLGISVCNKQRRKSVMGVCYPVSHWTAQAVLSRVQLSTSELAQQQVEKQVLIRQTRKGKGTRLCMPGWRMMNKSQLPLPWTWALSARPIIMLLICKAVKTAVQFETFELKDRCHDFWSHDFRVHLYSCQYISLDTWSYWNNLTVHKSCFRNEQIKI